MALVRIGPVALEFHGNPTFAWAGAPTDHGTRAATIGGFLDWENAQQLSELVANPDRSVPFAGEVGVLEPVWMDDELLSPFRGWYLFQSFNLSPDQQHSLGNSPVPFSLGAVHLGSVEPVVVHSSRARDNDYGLTAQDVMVDPFFGDNFVIPPSATAIEREYDPEPYDPARVVITPAVMKVYVGDLPEIAPLALEG